MTRVMVLGASGMLGQGVCQVLEKDPLLQVTQVTRENLDIMESWDDCLTTRGFEYVINCVGAIPQRKPPWTDEEYWETNCQFPKILVEKCAARGSKLIHVTTDCVYAGTKTDGPYVEGDPHDATDVYGRSKSGCEQYVVFRGGMVIRTSIVGRNLIRPTGLYEWFRGEVSNTVMASVQSNLRGGAPHPRIRGFINHWWNGVTTREFGRVCQKIIAQDLWSPELVHLFSPDTVSKYNLLQMFARHLQSHPGQVIPVEHPERIWRVLGTLKTFCSMVGVPPLEEQIRDIDVL